MFAEQVKPFIIPG